MIFLWLHIVRVQIKEITMLPFARPGTMPIKRNLLKCFSYLGTYRYTFRYTPYTWILLFYRLKIVPNINTVISNCRQGQSENRKQKAILIVLFSTFLPFSGKRKHEIKYLKKSLMQISCPCICILNSFFAEQKINRMGYFHWNAVLISVRYKIML